MDQGIRDLDSKSGSATCSCVIGSKCKLVSFQSHIYKTTPHGGPSWHDSETGTGSHSGDCRCCSSHLMPSTAPREALGAEPRLLAGPGHVLSAQSRANCQDGRERQTVPTLREQRPGEGRLLRPKEDGGWGLCCTEGGAGSCRATDLEGKSGGYSRARPTSHPSLSAQPSWHSGGSRKEGLQTNTVATLRLHAVSTDRRGGSGGA